MIDISESGKKIGEKLFVLLSSEQQQELFQFMSERENSVAADFPCISSEPCYLKAGLSHRLTEIQEGDLYICLEERIVCVRNQKVELTTKEFDALYLLVVNRKRVLTFESISYHVWGEEYIDVTTQAIHNLMSRLRQKLQITPDVPDYIISIRGVGYKFNS